MNRLSTTKTCPHCGKPVDTKFVPGARVRIIAKWVDFYPFYGETGVITENTGEYLGIQVKFDEPRHFDNGYIQEDFNFNPQHLEVIE